MAATVDDYPEPGSEPKPALHQEAALDKDADDFHVEPKELEQIFANVTASWKSFNCRV